MSSLQELFDIKKSAVISESAQLNKGFEKLSKLTLELDHLLARDGAFEQEVKKTGANMSYFRDLQTAVDTLKDSAKDIKISRDTRFKK